MTPPGMELPKDLWFPLVITLKMFWLSILIGYPPQSNITWISTWEEEEWEELDSTKDTLIEFILQLYCTLPTTSPIKDLEETAIAVLTRLIDSPELLKEILINSLVIILLPTKSWEKIMKEVISIPDLLKNIKEKFILALCSTVLENIPIWDLKEMKPQDPLELLKCQVLPSWVDSM